MPVPIWEQKPEYTSDAMRARVQGFVEVEAIVLENGSVGDVRITKSLDRVYGLDRQALAAAQKWRFKPATLHGVPTKVRVLILLEFRVR